MPVIFYGQMPVKCQLKLKLTDNYENIYQKSLLTDHKFNIFVVMIQSVMRS